MDFVIVGGGIYGCGVAWELARRGGEVLLLEANTIARRRIGWLGQAWCARQRTRFARASSYAPGLRSLARSAPGHGCTHRLYTHRPSTPDGAWTGSGCCPGVGLDAGGAGHSHTVAGTRLNCVQREPHVSPQVVAALYCPQDGVADHTATTKRHGARRSKAGCRDSRAGCRDRH